MGEKNYGYDVRYDMPGKLGQNIRALRAVKDWVQEHPAATTALAAAPALPATALGALGAGVLGVGSAIIDKSHPLTSERSDWEARTPAANLEDVLSAGAYNTAGAAAFPAARLVSRAVFGRAEPAVARVALEESPWARRLAGMREAVHGGNATRGFRYPERAIPLESSVSDASSVGMGVGYPVGPIIQPKAIPVAGPAPARSVDPFLVPLHDPYAANPLTANVATYAENSPIEELFMRSKGITDRAPASTIKPTGPLQEVPEMFVGRGPGLYFKKVKPSPGGAFNPGDLRFGYQSPLVKYPPDATSPAFLR